MKFLWRAYCLPGRLFALYKYLNPRRGELLVTARWKDSQLVHAFFSTVVYIGVFYVLISDESKIAGNVVAPISTTSASETNVPDAKAIDVAELITEEAAPQRIASDNEGHEVEEPNSLAPRTALTDDQENILSHIKEQPEVLVAVDDAYASGEPKSWTTSGLSGEAIPSPEDSRTGCVEIRITIKDMPNARQPYDPVYRCARYR